jgi:hypothetical protein
LQVLFARSGEDWRSARQLTVSAMHVLQPTGLNLMIHKASIDDLRVDK